MSDTALSRIDNPGLPPIVRQIITVAAARHWTTVTELLRGSQVKCTVEARADAIRALRMRGHSLTQIGRWLHIHHSTVLYHLQKQTLSTCPEPRTREIEFPLPDLSGEWAI